MAINSPDIRNEVTKYMKKLATETDTELMWGRRNTTDLYYKFVFGDRTTHEKIAVFIIDYNLMEDIFECMSAIKEQLYNKVSTHNACFGGYTYTTKTKTLNERTKEFLEYCKNDVNNTLDISQLYPRTMFAGYGRMTRTYASGQTIPEIEDVIFNEPATIVFWNDGTKTVVKAQDDDVFDPEKGLAMAIAKKAFGNEGNYCNKLKTWLDIYEKRQEIIKESLSLEEASKKYSDAMKRLREALVGPKTHSNVWRAYHRLHNALHDKKATKSDYKDAMEEAAGCLEKELDD